VPLQHYGVAIGTFVSFTRDPQDQFGRWYHGHLTIATPEGQYASALDVDTPSGVGVSYRISPNLAAADLGSIAGLADGWHALTPDSSSGAIDYLRSPIFQDALLHWHFPPVGPFLTGPRKKFVPPGPHPGPPPPGPEKATTAELAQEPGTVPEGDTGRSSVSRYARLPAPLRSGIEFTVPLLRLIRPWIPSTGDNALSALEAQLPSATRIYLFGDHYQQGLGVHDVHMNQGDPAGSQWWSTDGIWQDGAVFLERANGTLFGWQVKFNSQAFKTDAAGHPA
jgi:Uncharacterized conserved protein (DUF2278)